MTNSKLGSLVQRQLGQSDHGLQALFRLKAAEGRDDHGAGAQAGLLAELADGVGRGRSLERRQWQPWVADLNRIGEPAPAGPARRLPRRW